MKTNPKIKNITKIFYRLKKKIIERIISVKLNLLEIYLLEYTYTRNKNFEFIWYYEINYYRKSTVKVRYSYLPQQFGNCPDLWSKLKKFVSTGDFTLGKPLKEFENNFAKLTGTKYAVGVNSGTDAIKLSLKASGIKPGDEIITAANTFVATVGAIRELGAKPIFCWLR